MHTPHLNIQATLTLTPTITPTYHPHFQESLVRVANAKNILVLQYPQKLDIWRLGATENKPGLKSLQIR